MQYGTYVRRLITFPNSAKTSCPKLRDILKAYFCVVVDILNQNVYKKLYANFLFVIMDNNHVHLKLIIAMFNTSCLVTVSDRKFPMQFFRRFSVVLGR